MGVRQTARGNCNFQIVGDNNITNFIGARQVSLTHSLIYELLGFIYSAPSPTNDDYSLKDTAEMHDKLRYNNAQRYISIIDNHADDYARLCDVIKDYPNSEDIVKKLRDLFLKVAKIGDDGELVVADGDLQLDQIMEKLISLIIADAHYDAEVYPIEKVEQFCIALVAYGVSVCKILLRPE